MILLITGILCGLVSVSAAIILQFELSSWHLFAGLGHLRTSSRPPSDLHKIRRRVSVVYYLLSGGFLGGSLALYLKAIPPGILTSLYFLLILLALDGIVFNTHLLKARVLIICNIVLIVVAFLFWQ